MRYPSKNSTAFMRSRERYGKLSNMTGGFPLEVNGIKFQGSEGLYQALKFPKKPKFQVAIGAATSGMGAKKLAYTKSKIRKDWDEVKIEAMRFALLQKFLQHPDEFGIALLETEFLQIVEKSYRDDFWGARPVGQYFVGTNTLGILLTQLRSFVRNHSADEIANLFLVKKNTKLLVVNRRIVQIN